MTPITYKSQTLSLRQWAEHLNMHYDTLRKRYDAGWRPPRLFTKSRKTLATIPITYNGQTNQLRHWAEIVGVPYTTLRMRYKRGVRPPELFGAKYIPKCDQPETPSQVFITYHGKTHTLFQWSRIIGIGFDTLHKRYVAGERDPAKLLTTISNTPYST